MNFELTKEQYFVRRMMEQFVIDEAGKIWSREDVFRLFIRETEEREMERQKAFLADMNRRFALYRQKPQIPPVYPKFNYQYKPVHIEPLHYTADLGNLFKLTSMFPGPIINPERFIIVRGGRNE